MIGNPFSVSSLSVEKRKGLRVVRLADKEKKLAQYQEDLEKAKVAIVAEYRGLTVEQLSVLRSDLFKQSAKFSVVKNTLMKRAIKGTDGESLDEFFQGPMAVLFGFADEVAPTKTLKEFLQKAKLGEIKGGVLGSQKLSQKEVLEMAELPSLDELRARLLGAINSPLAGLVMSLVGPQQALVRILNQYAETLEKQAPKASASAPAAPAPAPVVEEPVAEEVIEEVPAPEESPPPPPETEGE